MHQQANITKFLDRFPNLAIHQSLSAESLVNTSSVCSRIKENTIGYNTFRPAKIQLEKQKINMKEIDFEKIKFIYENAENQIMSQKRSRYKETPKMREFKRFKI